MAERWHRGRDHCQKVPRVLAIWWFRNPVNSPVEVGKYPIIYRVSYIPGGCLGFQPSTVPIWESKFLRNDENACFWEPQERWDRWQKKSPNWQYIPLKKPHMGNRNNHWFEDCDMIWNDIKYYEIIWNNGYERLTVDPGILNLKLQGINSNCLKVIPVLKRSWHTWPQRRVSTGAFFWGGLHTTVSMPYQGLSKKNALNHQSFCSKYLRFKDQNYPAGAQPDAVFIQIHDVHPSVHGIASWSTWPNRGLQKKSPKSIDPSALQPQSMICYGNISHLMGICWFYHHFGCWLLLFLLGLRAKKPLLLSSWCCFCFPKSGSQNAKIPPSHIRNDLHSTTGFLFSKINGPLNLNLWSLKFSYWGILASLNRLNHMGVS